MQLSTEAKIFWEKIPPHIQVKLLNNAHCASCQKILEIGSVKGRVVSGDLILEGVCTTCGGPVCRLIEKPEI